MNAKNYINKNLLQNEMALLYLTSGQRTYIMIDGFISNIDGIKANRSLIERINKIDDGIFTSKYIRNDPDRLFFAKFIESCRNDFCSSKERKNNCFYEQCLYFEDIEKILRECVNKKNHWMDLSKYIPLLLLEYKNNNKISGDYVHNIIILDQPICCYPTVKKCCFDWIKKIKFKFKTKKEYLNYKDFTKAWLDILSKLYGDIKGIGIGSIPH